MTRGLLLAVACLLAGCSSSSGGSAAGAGGSAQDAATGGATASSGGSGTGGATGGVSATGGAQSGGSAGSDAGPEAGSGGAATGGTGGVFGTGGNTGDTWCAGAADKPCYRSDMGQWLCVDYEPAHGCSTQDCSCPAAPANAVQSCAAGGACDFTCDAGYHKDPTGTLCWPTCPSGSGQSNCGIDGACVNIFPPCACCIGLNTCGSLQSDGSCK